MGLSGRKVKQRIPKDPRNLSWADDAGRFGSNYLSKLGWDTSKGLGAEGEGRTSHIKVTHKLDMLGIGADHQRDPNGIAWKQNKDFENLLKRLNAGVENETLDTTARDGGTAEAEKDNDVDSEETTGIEHRKKRRKKDKDAHGCSRKEPAHETQSIETEQMVTQAVSQEIKKKVASAPPRHRSHRARAIAARNISSKSKARISEILGIAPTPSSSGLNSETETMHHEGKLTTLSDDLEIDKITTSTKSVAHYFKEKLDLQASRRCSSSLPLAMDTAGENPHGTPRMGLGASRIRFSPPSESTIERMGFSKFSSLMSSSTITDTSPFSTTPHIPLPFSSESPSTRTDPSPVINKNPETDTGSYKGKSKKEKNKRKRKTEAEEEKGEGRRRKGKEEDGLYVDGLPMVDHLERKVGDGIATSPSTDQGMGKGYNRRLEKKQKRVKEPGETDTEHDAKALCNSSTSLDISWKKDKHKRKSQLAEEV